MSDFLSGLYDCDTALTFLLQHFSTSCSVYNNDALGAALVKREREGI